MEFSKTYQYRKITKPLLERQRRARINKCLDQLKDLIIDCLKQDNDQILRLEKADILEYTVEYLRKTKIAKSEKNHEISTESFRNGYIFAANEVSKAMASTRDIDITLGTKLMSNLGHQLNCLQDNKMKSIESVQKRSYSPLNIETQTNYGNLSKLAAISPASSGYYSDSGNTSPVLNEEYFENSIKNVWRPW